MKKLVCPKCKALDLEVTETFSEHVIHSVVNGLVDPVPIDKQAGMQIGIQAKCLTCAHSWKPRGVSSLLDLPEIETEGSKP